MPKDPNFVRKTSAIFVQEVGLRKYCENLTLLEIEST